MAGGWPQHQADPWQGGRRQRPAGRHPLGHRRRRGPEVRRRRVLRRADDPERSQCVGPGSGDPRPGRRLHDRRARSLAAGLRRRGLRHDPQRGRRSACPDLQCGLSRRPRPAAREGTARTHPGRDVRYRPAYRQPRPLPGRQGSPAGDAQARRGLVLLFQQFELAARAQAHDRPVALLSPRHDAHPGAGAHRGIFRAWRACRQRGDRRHHRLARNPRFAEDTAEPRPGDQSGEDRRGVLLPARPGPLVLDARAATDAVSSSRAQSGRSRVPDAAGRALPTHCLDDASLLACRSSCRPRCSTHPPRRSCRAAS